MRDPRSHRRYVAARAAWLPTAEPWCCLCSRPVDLTLPAGLPTSPTVEHTLPIRTILAMAGSYAEAVALACDTSLWRTAHLICQQRQGAQAGNRSPKRGVRRRSSRVW